MSTIIRSPNWIGDGIMSLPAIRACRDHFPSERLTVLAKRYLADIYLNIPEIDEILPIPDRWTVGSFVSAARELRQKRFDRGILFTNSFSSALLFRLAGVPSLAGYARDGRGWLLQQKTPRPGSLEQHHNYYLNIIEHWAGKRTTRDYASSLSVLPAERDWAAGRLAEQGIDPGLPLLAVSPGAAYGSAKAWPPERFHEFIRRWSERHPGFAVLLLGTAAEKERTSAVAAGLPGRILDLAGCLSLRQSIAILSRCRMFIGNDSGMMHVAAALGLPLAVIFGPTEPERTAPLAARFRLLYHGSDCAPCLHRDCPSDHRCMTAVGVDEVLAAALDLWEEEVP
jgi:heptosyltransferase-2